MVVLSCRMLQHSKIKTLNSQHFFQAEAKVSFPRQNLDQLQNIRPADLSRATQSIRTNPPMHEILNQARQLQRFQQMDRKKH